jgi:hypothetical protein
MLSKYLKCHVNYKDLVHPVRFIIQFLLIKQKKTFLFMVKSFLPIMTGENNILEAYPNYYNPI